MIKTERVSKTVEFLRDRLSHSDYFKDRPADIAYRIEHSIRVANIGGEIARHEGLDEERLVIACLLHDIAYCLTFPKGYSWRNHGREGAKIAREFLSTLGYEGNELEEMCFGIAIHADDEADFEWERTPFALSVVDADNIDRFDAYRLYETICDKEFEKLGMEERMQWLDAVIPRLGELREIKFATNYAQKLWYDKVDFQIEYFTRLREQMLRSIYTED